MMTVLSAILLVLSFPNFNIWPLAWIAFVPLLFSIENDLPLKAFLKSYLTGFIFFLGTIYWLIHVTLPGMIAVAAYLALYFGIFGLVVSAGRALNKNMMLLSAPSAWVASEWLRSNLLTGFPWALLGHSQAFGNLPIIQIADITGAFGVSFLIMFVNSVIYLTVSRFRAGKGIPAPALLAAFLVIMLVLRYGYIRMNNIFTGEGFRVSVAQGNIPQSKKWDEAFSEHIMKRYEDLTKSAAAERPDLIIWPETAVPGFLESEEALLSRVRSAVISAGIPVLVGTPRYDPDAGACYNSASLFSADGRIVKTYDKIHLVPFGEYIPFRKSLSFVEKFAHNPIGDFSSGGEYTVFSFFIRREIGDADSRQTLMKKVKFSCLICFEDIFPELSRRLVAGGASLLVNVTNDAWFMKSAAPYQHAQCSVFRAVENRVGVVRSANTGLSCFIDQKGRIVDRVGASGDDIFVEGYRSREIVLNRASTFYNRYGDVFSYICMAIAALFLLLPALPAAKVPGKTG